MNGIYLHLLLKEVHDRIIGLSIVEVRRHDRLIQIIGDDVSLFVSLYPGVPGIFLAGKIMRDFEPIKIVSDYIKSSKIIKIDQQNFMPVLKIKLERSSLSEKENFEIIISLYRDAPNFSLKTPSAQKNLFSRYIEKKPKKSIFELEEEKLSAMQDRACLIKNFEGFDRYLANELTAGNLKKLKAMLLDKISMKPRLVSASPMRISFFTSTYVKEFISLNKLVEETVKEFLIEKKRASIVQQKSRLIKNFKNRIENLKKKLMKDEEIEYYRIKGELILTNILRIKKGFSQARVFNPYTKKEINIKLDALKTPQENAQDYFTKYKKMKRGQPKIRRKIEQLKKQLNNINEMIAEEQIQKTKIIPTRAVKKPFHMFTLESGAVVYTGKNAKANEQLTFKLARPDDYFFHVRGFEGAHTILKAKVPKGHRPSREDIRTAAAIAAYFSKAKTQKNVPVSYTQRKYLKKNKKGKAGSVVLMREEVIFVDPILPS